MQIYRVSQITAYIKELFDSDYALQDLWLEGEVSNYSRSRMRRPRSAV
jgi:exonuclease VII large subunit